VFQAGCLYRWQRKNLIFRLIQFFSSGHRFLRKQIIKRGACFFRPQLQTTRVYYTAKAKLCLVELRTKEVRRAAINAGVALLLMTLTISWPIRNFTTASDVPRSIFKRCCKHRQSKIQHWAPRVDFNANNADCMLHAVKREATTVNLS